MMDVSISVMARKLGSASELTKAYGQHLLETPLSIDQTVKDMGGEYLITATVVDSDRLDWWLRGFGDELNCIRKMTLL